ncbi:hypothetical protein WICPIJ_006348 [Wickerhamomyces pijperi]|uniref:Uncharacterized protein n=1 Tax=Wickerhamomyces pijperi TaxID=599730 RepID=A0A9P8TL39_WICPI|nr:hypothetical protein WICPIJ_006348 [Wickerhamomyces pijperi]
MFKMDQAAANSVLSNASAMKLRRKPDFRIEQSDLETFLEVGPCERLSFNRSWELDQDNRERNQNGRNYSTHSQAPSLIACSLDHSVNRERICQPTQTGASIHNTRGNPTFLQEPTRNQGSSWDKDETITSPDDETLTHKQLPELR